MTALTNEIIGAVLVAVVVVVVLIVRHLRLSSQRRQRPDPGPSGEPVGSRAPGPSAQSQHLVTSAFGPAPVWAGGSPASPRVRGSDHGAQGRLEVLPPAAPRPEATPRAPLPPPVSLPLAASSAPRWAQQPSNPASPESAQDPSAEQVESVPGSEADPEPRSDPRPGSDEGPESSTAPEHHTEPEPDPNSAGTVRPGPTTPEHHGAGPVAPVSSAHPSMVMHVSSLRAPAAEQVPTDWMVVTPMDLLGEPPDGVATPAQRKPPEAVLAVPTAPEPQAPGSHPPGASIGDPADTPGDGTGAPNPFAPREPRSPGEQSSQGPDIGMPSSLLKELLGSEPAEPTE